MSIFVNQESPKQFVIVATLDSIGRQAVAAAYRALSSSRWESHRQIAEKLRREEQETESGAVDIVLNESAAKRIEDDIHYKAAKGRVAVGAERLQQDLAIHLGLDARRPLRAGK